MLFPKHYMNKKEKDSSNFVLRDNNGNSIHGIISLSTNLNIEIMTHEEKLFHQTELSDRDLQVLVKEISSILNNSNASDESITFNEYLVQQNVELEKMNQSNDENGIFPTVEECLNTKNFIFKSKSDAVKIIDSENTIFKSNVNYSFPKIFKCDISDLDFDGTMQWVSEFRKFRNRLGLSQLDVSCSLEKHLTEYINESSICRFESKNLSFTNIKRILPVLKKWVDNVCPMNKDALLSELKALKNIRKKKDPRRTKISPEIIEDLEHLYATVRDTSISAAVYKKYSQRHNIPAKRIQVWMTKRRKKERLNKYLKETRND